MTTCIDSAMAALTERFGAEKAETMRPAVELNAQAWDHGVDTGLQAATALIDNYVRVLMLVGDDLAHMLLLKREIDMLRKKLTGA
jgi:hypothetical protein